MRAGRILFTFALAGLAGCLRMVEFEEEEQQGPRCWVSEDQTSCICPTVPTGDENSATCPMKTDAQHCCFVGSVIQAGCWCTTLAPGQTCAKHVDQNRGNTCSQDCAAVPACPN